MLKYNYFRIFKIILADIFFWRQLGRGYVTTDELRQVLNELGEYMDPNEVRLYYKKMLRLLRS
jgi:hypothetical protein